MTGRLRRPVPLLVSAAGAVIVALDGTFCWWRSPARSVLAASPAQIR